MWIVLINLYVHELKQVFSCHVISLWSCATFVQLLFCQNIFHYESEGNWIETGEEQRKEETRITKKILLESWNKDNFNTVANTTQWNVGQILSKRGSRQCLKEALSIGQWQTRHCMRMGYKESSKNKPWNLLCNLLQSISLVSQNVSL